MDMQNLHQTSIAVADLKQSLSRLRDVLLKKKNAISQQRDAYKANIATKNAEIEHLKQAVTTAAQKINSSIQKIDEVIGENGSSNNLH